MDCVTVDSACNGELMNNGFAFAVKNATCTEDSYSCAATKGTRKGIDLAPWIAQGSVTRYKDVHQPRGSHLSVRVECARMYHHDGDYHRWMRLAVMCVVTSDVADPLRVVRSLWAGGNFLLGQERGSSVRTN